jgi:hypothetical protein
METTMADLSITNHGSLFLLRGASEAGEAWLTENIPDARCFAGLIAVEPRYIRDIAEGAVNDGLTVEQG